jgi:hypothetical protein
MRVHTFQGSRWGTYKVRNEMKRNETKSMKTKRKEINEMKRNQPSKPDLN